jgi:hypothetical protein
MERRTFIKSSVWAGAGVMASGLSFGNTDKDPVKKGLRVGIIGLDTSHAIAFTKSLNAPDAPPEFGGYRVTVAYPQGSKDIESSLKRVPGYIEEVRKLGVEIVETIPRLIEEIGCGIARNQRRATAPGTSPARIQSRENRVYRQTGSRHADGYVCDLSGGKGL